MKDHELKKTEALNTRGT